LKPIEQDNNLSLVKAAKDSKDITANFHPDFVKGLLTLNMLEKFLWYSVNMSYKEKYIIYFLLYALGLPFKKILKVVSVKYQLSDLLHSKAIKKQS
jgi:hypothetical protein